MSHVSVGAAVVNDSELELEALAQACEEAGLVFCKGVKEYKWYGRWVRDYHAEDAAYRHGVRPEDYGKCEHMIRLPQTLHEEEVYAQNPDARPYEIGLVRTADGKFQMVIDHWHSGKGVPELLARAGGQDMRNLARLTTKHKILLQASRQKGHEVKSVERLGAKTKMVIKINPPPDHGGLR
jgi:hypothetical protein